MASLAVTVNYNYNSTTAVKTVPDGTQVDAWATSRFLRFPSGNHLPPVVAADGPVVTTASGAATLTVPNLTQDYWLRIRIVTTGQQHWFKAASGLSAVICTFPFLGTLYGTI